MGCLDTVLEMRETWFYEGKGRRVWVAGALGEIAWGSAIGCFVYNVILLLYFLRGRVGHNGLQAKTKPCPGGVSP